MRECGSHNANTRNRISETIKICNILRYGTCTLFVHFTCTWCTALTRIIWLSQRWSFVDNNYNGNSIWMTLIKVNALHHVRSIWSRLHINYCISEAAVFKNKWNIIQKNQTVKIWLDNNCWELYWAFQELLRFLIAKNNS